MKPLLHPHLVNGPFEDPVLYVDVQYERRALLFDLGNLRRLPPRKLLRVTEIFVTHPHMDHFQDFDWLLRLALGRGRSLRVFGPPGMIEKVGHKLAAYTWNVAHRYEEDLTFTVTEVGPGGGAGMDPAGRRAVFRLRAGFPAEASEEVALPGGVLFNRGALEARAALLDHDIPCLGFAVREREHVNFWKSRLEEMGLSVGPWLREARAAILAGAGAGTVLRARWRDGAGFTGREVRLGDLVERAVRIVPGQGLGYVVDVRDTPANRGRITELVRGVDVLFAEAAFLHADRGHAERKNHLTARAAGEIARAAGVRVLEPIHFSPRYEDREDLVRAEAEAAFNPG